MGTWGNVKRLRSSRISEEYACSPADGIVEVHVRAFVLRWLVEQRPVGCEPPPAGLHRRRWEGVQLHLEAVGRRARHLVASAVLEEDPYSGLGCGTRRRPPRSPRRGGRSGRVPARAGSRSTSANCNGASARISSGMRGTLPGHVEAEELEPAVHDHRAVAVGVMAVEEVEPGVRAVVERLDHEREAAAGLLVLPGTGEVDGHLDVAHHVGHPAGRERRAEVAHGAPEGFEVEVLAADAVVGRGDLVALGHPLRVPALTPGFRLEVASSQPRPGEPRVVDAARPLLAPQVVDHRQRCDGGQARRSAGSHEELADARVAESDHAGAAVEHPGLAGDDLDHVVAVGRLRRAQHVEHAAGAAAATHVHSHHREAQQVGEQGARLRLVGVGGGVARVLDRQSATAAGRTGRSWGTAPSSTT